MSCDPITCDARRTGPTGDFQRAPTPTPVPLRAEHGFRMQAADVAARITPRSRLIFLNTPHNPTGAILTRADLVALGQAPV